MASTSDDEMTALSVVTATHTAPGMLARPLEAIRTLQNRLEVRWIVAVDTDDDELATQIENVVQTAGGSVVRTPRRWGIAAARNYALTTVDTPWVASLDHDDDYLPAFADMLAAAVAENVSWVAGGCSDMDAATGTETFTWVPADGVSRVAPRWAGNTHLATGRWPLMCSASAVRTSLLRAVGGWAASYRSEDVLAWAAITEAAPGLLWPQPVHRWWHSPDQTTATAWWNGEQGIAQQTVRDRILALRHDIPGLVADASEPEGTWRACRRWARTTATEQPDVVDELAYPWFQSMADHERRAEKLFELANAIAWPTRSAAPAEAASTGSGEPGRLAVYLACERLRLIGLHERAAQVADHSGDLENPLIDAYRLAGQLAAGGPAGEADPALIGSAWDAARDAGVEGPFADIILSALTDGSSAVISPRYVLAACDRAEREGRLHRRIIEFRRAQAHASLGDADSCRADAHRALGLIVERTPFTQAFADRIQTILDQSRV